MHMQYPKAILFDLDGTILELNATVEKCWRIKGKSAIKPDRMIKSIVQLL